MTSSSGDHAMRRLRSPLWNAVVPTMILLSAASVQSAESSEPQVTTKYLIHMPAFDLPASEFVSPQTHAEIEWRKQQRRRYQELVAERCGEYENVMASAWRQCHADVFYESDEYKRLRQSYAVNIDIRTINGVQVEIFTPDAGIASHNNARVLINLHGGTFQTGARANSRIESMPVSDIAKIKVISIDYRMAPEHVFPAASEDVVAVYRELLKTYKPEDIGIYGSSAGGMLTAQAVAWFQNEHLPLPGAVAMLFGAAYYWNVGDSLHMIDGTRILPVKDADTNPYFNGADFTSSLVIPGVSDAVMARFPTSLLISASRDFALSSVIGTHRQLRRLDVQAELNIWEGLGHVFAYNAALPESNEMYETVVEFFDRNLGERHK